MAKSLFIGLGGCGLKTVSELYKKLHPLDPSGEDYLFLYVDTDEKTLDLVNHDSIVIRRGDFINLGSTNPHQIYERAMTSDDDVSVRLKEWAIQQGEPGHLTFPNQPLSDGAQAVRMFGRFGIVKEQQAIITGLKQKLTPFQNIHDENGKVVDPDIWVFASSCGGTGSSLTLDILYIINRILLNELNLHDPQLKLVLFMPQPFIALNPGNVQYYLNAYAYMWELNAFRMAFQNGLKDVFGEFSAIPHRIGWGDDPFQMFKYVIPVDAESDHRNKITVEELYTTVAEMVYFLHLGNVKNGAISNMCNDHRLLNGVLTRHNDTRCVWTTPLIAYGYRAVKKANQELLKYLKTRGMFEIVRYGLLGDDMTEEEREPAKQEFAKKYILPYLVGIDGISKINSQSIQNRLGSLYEDIFPLKADGLQDNKVDFALNEVATKSTTVEFENACRQTYDDIKQAISNGLSEVIRMHGLIYAKTLLNVVDDHYLEKVILDKLEAELNDIQRKTNDSKAQCESYRGSLKKKNNAVACAAVFEDYRHNETRYQAVKKSIEIIQNLTSYPMGFLEELRRGTNNKVGLQKLIEKANASCVFYANAYEELAKEFCASENNSFTTYLPNLKDIALGDNQDWPSDTLFDQLYSNSILDYDREKANKIGSKRVPVRKSESSENKCISYYLQDIDKENTLFVALAQMDNFKLADLFEKRVIDALDISIQKAIDNPSSQASKWLSISLEMALQQPDFLPADKPLHKFIEQLSNKEDIHVLYPMRNGNAAASCRYYYAGASESLAAMLGYKEGGDGVQFIKDSQMTDRFLIMKMPIGLDFYSYAYFSTIEEAYNKNYSKILAQSDCGGCHIHKAFASLDLEKALKEVTMPRKLNALKLLTKAMFFQQTLKVMKTNAPDTYNELFGIFTMPILGESAPSEAAPAADSFMAMFTSTDDSAGTFNESTIGSGDDNFLEFNINNTTGKWQVDIYARSVELKADGTLMVDDANNQMRYVLSQQQLMSGSAFAEGIIKANEGGLLRLLAKQVEVFEQLKRRHSFVTSLIQVFTATKTACLALGTPQQPKFAMFMEGWKKNAINNDFLKAIISTINNMQM